MAFEQGSKAVREKPACMSLCGAASLWRKFELVAFRVDLASQRREYVAHTARTVADEQDFGRTGDGLKSDDLADQFFELQP